MKGRLLSIDVGEKRVGLAMSDELGIIASPYGFIDRDSAIEKIETLVSSEDIGFIVIGLPLLKSGDRSPQTEDIYAFSFQLSKKIDIKIDYENEILTSKEAEDRLKKAGKRYEKGDIDAMAACIILESYLRSV